jgi:hypothetical protein
MNKNLIPLALGFALTVALLAGCASSAPPRHTISTDDDDAPVTAA